MAELLDFRRCTPTKARHTLLGWTTAIFLHQEKYPDKNYSRYRSHLSPFIHHPFLLMEDSFDSFEAEIFPGRGRIFVSSFGTNFWPDSVVSAFCEQVLCSDRHVTSQDEKTAKDSVYRQQRGRRRRRRVSKGQKHRRMTKCAAYLKVPQTSGDDDFGTKTYPGEDRCTP